MLTHHPQSPRGAGCRGGHSGGLSTPTPPPAPAAPGAMEPGAPPAPHCTLEPRPPYEPVPAALCAIGAVFGVVCGCFGYRCFKAIMFLSGLLFGSIVIFLLCYKERVLETQLSLEASVGIALGIGLLCGLVTMLLRSVGLFTTGLLLGLLLATAALVAAAPVLPPPSPWVPAGSLLGLALLCALLALQWPKALTVLSTAVFGAAVVVVCVDYFVEALALVLYVYHRLRLAPAGPLCWHGWAVLGAWPALSLLAVLLQWKLTANGFSHTDVILSRRQKRLQLLRIRQKEAKRRQSLAPPEGTYRRKPPPVKRYAGDVLAPSYIRSLRDRQQESGTSPGPDAPPAADCSSAAPSPPRRRP
ncbi:transmembrane protein 198-like isoform X1 [Balearica regulorum gibbericeps]|uniref:transmembrane protein 198-like isoform X1 n=2 Tax=Balearica regulorum gibbericeps TaxID=100784 RepID=UPI003F62B20A